ncbi:hypothetical protein AB0761_36410 [Peterkaempfera sp. SMS 1(5)a]
MTTAANTTETGTGTTGGPTPTPAPPRQHALRRFARGFAQHRSGLVGLGILATIGLLALCSPLFIGPDQLDVVKVDGPTLAPPSGSYPLGTDQAGRSILLLVIWGARSSLTVGLMATALTVWAAASDCWPGTTAAGPASC